jgi:hypothetical protein
MPSRQNQVRRPQPPSTRLLGLRRHPCRHGRPRRTHRSSDQPPSSADPLCIAIGIVRAKATASILVPPASSSLGIHGSIIDLAQSLAGMGMQDSGVRQIAKAAG